MSAYEYDPVHRPRHYNTHPSGVECIRVSRHLPGNLANAWKYIYRHRAKGAAKRDLEKACWYLRDQARHLGPAGDILPDLVLADALEIIDHEPDHRLQEAMRTIIVNLNTSQLERAAQLVEAVITDLEQAA